MHIHDIVNNYNFCIKASVPHGSTSLASAGTSGAAGFAFKEVREKVFEGIVWTPWMRRLLEGLSVHMLSSTYSHV